MPNDLIPARVRVNRKGWNSATFREELAFLRTMAPRLQEIALFIMQDIVLHAKQSFQNCRYLERTPTYYAQFPFSSVQVVLRYLFGQMFPAYSRSVRDIRTMGFFVRDLTPESPRYGTHYLFPSDVPDFLKLLLDALAKDGIVPPPGMYSPKLGEPLTVSLITRGQRQYLVCPAHDDKDPSAMVQTNGFVYCYACNRRVGFMEGGMYRPLLGWTGSPTNHTPNHPPATDPQPKAYLRDPGLAANVTFSDSLFSAGSPTTAPPKLLAPTGVRGHDPITGDAWQRPPRPIGLVLAKRHGDRSATRYGKTGMHKTMSSHMDVLDLLSSADTRWRKTDETAKGWEAFSTPLLKTLRIAPKHADRRTILPDLYFSLDWQAGSELRSQPTKTRSGDPLEVLSWSKYTAHSGQWVAFDLDKFSDSEATPATLQAAGERIQYMLEENPLFTGRIGIVRTSHLGIQVFAELSEARADLHAFYDHPDVQALLSQLGQMMLEEMHEAGFSGGHLDPTSHQPGRFFRRPGPRIDKRGMLYISRLVYRTPKATLGV